MNPEPTPDTDETSPSQLVVINRICDRFEQAIRDGKHPRIEDELAAWPEAALGPLLRELLAVELEYLRSVGSRPSLLDLRSRFPEHASVVEDVLGAIDESADDSLGPVDATPQSGRSEAGFSVGTTFSQGRRYRVLRPHARGGLGAVFVALDAELNREVALKEMLDRLADDPASRQRFLVEAEITGSLEHPGIVPVYGLGFHQDGRPYYAMRFIKGDSLKEAIAAFHADSKLQSDPGAWSLALNKLLRRFLDVCNAIDYAHSRGVLHRDIKPGNVIVGKYGETLVVDWGLAKSTSHQEPGGTTDEASLTPRSASGSTATLPGFALGSPAYMSPEQAAGDLQRIGPRSDVYGLGATLYQLLVGRTPFDGADMSEVMKRVREGDFLAPRARNPEIDRAIEAVCLKAMAHDPGARYASARELADDVERWLADESVTAWREPFTRRILRSVKRHRVALTGAAAALIVGTTGLAAVVGVQARLNADLRHANEDVLKAKAATESALVRSEESRRQAESVKEFLITAFRSPDPSLNGRDVKVADVLDEATKLLDGEFNGTEETRAAIVHAIGQTYESLGLPDRAEANFIRSVELRTRLLGPDHRDTLISRNNLGNTLAHSGRAREAIPILEETLRRREAALGTLDPDTLTSRDVLGLAYQEAGRHQEAVDLHERAQRERSEVFGPEDPLTLTSLNNLAMAYTHLGREREALALHERIIKAREKILGPEHPRTLISRSNLASLYRSLGRLDDAIAAHKEILAIRERKLGPSHPDTISSLNNLASAYFDVQREGDGVKQLEESFRRTEAALGKDHPFTIVVRNNLAVAYGRIGRRAEAIKLQEESLAISEKVQGRDHPDTITRRANLAVSYHETGRVREAAAMLEEVVQQSEKALGPEHPSTIRRIFNLTRAYKSLGRDDSATERLEQMLERCRRALGPDDSRTLECQSNLASMYSLGGRATEAIPMFEDVRARRIRLLGPSHPDTLWIDTSLATAYQKIGRKAEAIGLLEEAVGKMETALGFDHVDTTQARTQLATAYRTDGRPDEAIRILERIARHREQTLSPDDPRTLRSRSDLALAYQTAGRLSEAIALNTAVLERWEAIEGPRHAETLISRNNLGVCYKDAGRVREAIELHESTLHTRESLYGPDHRDTLISRANLALSYEAADLWAKTEPLRRDVLSRRRKFLNAADPLLTATLSGLGLNLLKQAKWAEAEPFLREALTRRAGAEIV